MIKHYFIEKRKADKIIKSYAFQSDLDTTVMLDNIRYYVIECECDKNEEDTIPDLFTGYEDCFEELINSADDSYVSGHNDG